MIVWGWWTRGAAPLDVATPPGPNWAHPVYGRRHRVFPPRIRDDFWVEPGHVETDDPATDTREV
jgi:hypothetical protein